MPTPIQIEVAVDSVVSATAAERGGAARLELCSNLLEGGVTPSAGLLAQVRARTSIPVVSIIRPRPSDFFYSEEECAVMRRDIDCAKNLGADGVVLGLLTPAGQVDMERTRELIDLARPLSITFHRAFDMSADLFRALEDICNLGVDRILTSGGEPTAVQGADSIARLVSAARGRCVIMAGGGIRFQNASEIVKRTAVREIHVGLRSSVPSPMLYRNDRVSMGKSGASEYERWQVLEEEVRKLREAL